MARQGLNLDATNRWETIKGESTHSRVKFVNEPIGPELDDIHQATNECTKIEVREIDTWDKTNTMACIYTEEITMDRLATLQRLYNMATWILPHTPPRGCPRNRQLSTGLCGQPRTHPSRPSHCHCLVHTQRLESRLTMDQGLGTKPYPTHQ